ncbi:unnamed protein product [Ixodes pacificus]
MRGSSNSRGSKNKNDAKKGRNAAVGLCMFYLSLRSFFFFLLLLKYYFNGHKQICMCKHENTRHFTFNIHDFFCKKIVRVEKKKKNIVFVKIFCKKKKQARALSVFAFFFVILQFC